MSLSYPCGCGSKMVPKVGTVDQVVGGKEILIRNAPYYECLTCSEIEFDLSANIASISSDARRQGLSEVDYEHEIKKYEMEANK